MQNKMKLLFRPKTWLYPSNKKTDNYTKTVSLFKYCLNALLKSLRFLEIDWFFFYQFLNKYSILLDRVYSNTYS